MHDPWDTTPVVSKGRRICASPTCGKVLSTLNKQPFCYVCHDLALLERVTGRFVPRQALPTIYGQK